MGRKRVSKSSKHRLVIFGTLSCFVIIYSFYSIFNYIIEIRKLERLEVSLQEQFNVLLADEDNVRIEIEKMKDPDYLARYAMENFLYSKDDKIVIRLDDNNNLEVVNSELEKYDKKIFFALGAFLIILIVYLLLRFRKRKE